MGKGNDGFSFPHLCQRPNGLGGQETSPLRLGLETLGVGAPHLAWGHSTPLGRRPSLEIQSPRAGAPPRGPIYSGREEGQPHPSPWRLPLPPVTLLPLPELGEALPRSPLLPPPHHRAAGSASTSPSPLLDQVGGDVFPTVRVLNAEVLPFGTWSSVI